MLRPAHVADTESRRMIVTSNGSSDTRVSYRLQLGHDRGRSANPARAQPAVGRIGEDRARKGPQIGGGSNLRRRPPEAGQFGAVPRRSNTPRVICSVAFSNEVGGLARLRYPETCK